MLKNTLNKRVDLQKYLYTRGFLITDSKLDIHKEGYPFYGNWHFQKVKKYKIGVHEDLKLFILEKSEISFFLIGHAYNPFTMDYLENSILETLAEAYMNSEEEYVKLLNDLTGVFTAGFISNQGIKLFGDAAGIQTTYYGIHDSKLYVSSHSELLGDVCNLEKDEYVKELIQYKYYKLFGRYLPGDISPYKNFKRLIPNFSVEYNSERFNIARFYPTYKIESCSEENYSELINKAALILSNNMKLIHKKWDNPAISLTGGCDSKTTLACTKGEYENYNYFSYISNDSEEVDAIAAKKICDKLGLQHKTYMIPINNSEFDDYDIYEQILEQNCGNIGKNNNNDIRKRIFFNNNDDFDVEVKSWVSEIGRAYYHKRFDKRSFPKKVTSRYLTTLYKVFLHNRKLVRQTDKIFEEFLKKYYTDQDFQNVPWYDLLFWEFRVGSWNSLVITGEHRMSFDITIPYNNRRLLELLLSTSIEKRIHDIPHKDIMRASNKEIADIGISVTNVKHTNKRAKMERIYLEVHSRMPL